MIKEQSHTLGSEEFCCVSAQRRLCFVISSESRHSQSELTLPPSDQPTHLIIIHITLTGPFNNQDKTHIHRRLGVFQDSVIQNEKTLCGKQKKRFEKLDILI